MRIASLLGDRLWTSCSLTRLWAADSPIRTFLGRLGPHWASLPRSGHSRSSLIDSDTLSSCCLCNLRRCAVPLRATKERGRQTDLLRRVDPALRAATAWRSSRSCPERIPEVAPPLQSVRPTSARDVSVVRHAQRWGSRAPWRGSCKTAGCRSSQPMPQASTRSRPGTSCIRTASRGDSLRRCAKPRCRS